MRLITLPDARLRQVAAPIVFAADGPDVGRAHLQRLVITMIEVMGQHDGIGLAAPQLGQPLRVIVVHRSVAGPGPRVLFNPVLTREDGAPVLGREGCLSVPGYTGMVARAPRVVAAYQDQDGIAGLVEARGMYARVLQHEIDHLDGILLPERMAASGKGATP
jgi:methionyl-tRNA formyltransferase